MLCQEMIYIYIYSSIALMQYFLITDYSILPTSVFWVSKKETLSTLVIKSK